MKTLKATYRGEPIFIHYVGKFLEYLLISRKDDGTGMFKVGTSEVSDITEKELSKLLIEQELIEQERKKGSH